MSAGCDYRPIFGVGINSVRVRFTLMTVVLSSVAIGTGVWATGALHFSFKVAAISVLVIAISALIMFAAASKLRLQIKELTEKAEQIAAGALDTEVVVNCRCDVGGLAFSMQQMLSTLRSNLTEITNLAHFDQVTGLPNRRHLTNCLNYRVSSTSQNTKICGSILYLDLNGFKQVNDTFGHSVGDELLKAAAGRILNAAINKSIQENTCDAMDRERGCKSAVLARFGGDEFILHVPNVVSTSELNDISNKIFLALSEAFDIDGRIVHISTSIGIARYPADAKDGESLLRNADLAMYAAKHSPQGKHVFFEASLLQCAAQQRAIEVELKKAIHYNELVVFYQPKIEVSSERVVGVEALVRWKHPTKGLLGPASFIEIAENTGLIIDLGMYVTEAAIIDCAKFYKNGAPIGVSINLSLAQLEQESFSDQVKQMLLKHGAPPELITLEITESVASINLSRVQAQIQPLRELGIKFAIDDFGTGYSNLAKLLGLKFDELKIDRSLIKNIGTNQQHRAVVQMICDLARNMESRVLAEGIETIDQFAIIKQLGCDEVQGFMFAKPMPVDQLREWEAKRSPQRQRLRGMLTQQPLQVA